MAEGQDELAVLVYLSFADALEIFAAIIGATTPRPADQLRRPAALPGALGRRVSYAHYQEAHVALQAVLAHGIAGTGVPRWHTRVALVSMLTFLELNGYRVRAAVAARASSHIRETARLISKP